MLALLQCLGCWGQVGGPPGGDRVRAARAWRPRNGPSGERPAGEAPKGAQVKGDPAPGRRGLQVCHPEGEPQEIPGGESEQARERQLASRVPPSAASVSDLPG